MTDSLDPAGPPVTVTPARHAPRIWKFWGTVLWGLFIFAALFVGQIAVVAWFVLRRKGRSTSPPLSTCSAAASPSRSR
jgi:hypothetical protein